MATSPTAQVTDFTRDVLGRYVCNGLDEVMHSADPNVRRPDGSPQNDARPFDIIIIGGGTFGSALAQHLFNADVAHRRRILVLEGGPFLLTEHTQDLPMIGLNVPNATSIQQLRQSGQFGPDKPQAEVWGLPWHSSTAFPGLAYCLGGRSLYWGGWSPRLLDEEMPTSGSAPNPWPAAVVSDLNGRYFQEATEQIGVDESNDFIFGPLQNALRQLLVDGINNGQVTDAIPLTTLPDHPAVRSRATPPTVAEILDLLGLPAPSGPPPPAQVLLDMLKVEAPLAVQTRTLSGFFPFNKFSSVPLLMKAVRTAQNEAGNDDVKKRLMVVPECHVTRLVTASTPGGLNVVGLETDQGPIAVQPGAPVIIALGTIESTRLVLLALQGQPSVSPAGANLMAHMRSNLTIRIPRAALPGTLPQALQAGALFVKGRHPQSDGSFGHFHLQITAAGLGALGTDSEAELFKKIPDIDTFDAFRDVSRSHVVITIRGVGEMEPLNPQNLVRLDPEVDEFGAQRAFVALNPTANDQKLWDAMDQAAADVAAVFAGSQPLEVLFKNRDGLGTTHHEAGALWMGDRGASKSVTDEDLALYDLSNAFVLAPAVYPTLGSPNPMLTGIALARRLGNHLCPPPTPYTPEPGFTALFDSFSTGNWRMSTIKNQPGRDNPGSFLIADGTLESITGTDIGLYWCTTPMPPDFILKLEWLRWEDYDNSGVFIRFPDPESKGYNNSAYVAVDFGFEVQIDEAGRPDGAPIHKTGAIYRADNRTDNEVLTQIPAKPPGAGQWNEYEIRVQGQTYTVTLNGQQVCVFNNPYPGRGLPSTAAIPTYIGLQTHTGRVAFRNIRFKPI
jgi:choline dehydrogenase-like flavoprotein